MTKKKKEELDLNPAVKFGDRVLIITSNNHAKHLEGKVVEVMTSRKRASKSNFSVKLLNTEDFRQYGIYYTHPADEFVLATKENILMALELRKEGLISELEQLEKDIDFHKNYDSEEEFVADKLDDLLSAHARGGSKGERKELMTDILKELKKSNLI